MQDRVSIYPGRVKLTPVSGRADTYDMERADSPTQEGTPLNKASFLKDTTAELYGKDASAVPDEIFSEIHSRLSALDVFELGDVLTSSRRNLGDKWLLCNGAQLKRTEYPVIENLALPYALASITASKVTIGNIVEHDGLLATAGFYNETIFIYTAAAPDGPWSENSFTDVGWGKFNSVRIAYGNGLWVVFATSSSGSSQYVAYATTPTGTWTKLAAAQNMKFTVSSLAYGGGVWVAAGQDGDNHPSVLTTTDPTALNPSWAAATGTWVQKQVSTAVGCINSVAFAGSNWVAAGWEGRSAEGAVFTATDPANAWGKVTQTFSGVSIFSAVRFLSNMWCAVGYNGSGTTTNSIYTAEDPAGTWNRTQLPLLPEQGTHTTIASDIEYVDGKWIVSAYMKLSTASYRAYLYSAGTVYGPFTIEALAAGDVMPRSIAENGADWVVVNGNDAGNPFSVSTSALRTVPTISVGGAYAYIKVKE